MVEMKHDLNTLPVSWMGRFFYYLLPIRKQIVLDNIDRVFKKSITTKEKIRLAKAFYSHAATTLKEMITMDWLSPKHLDESVEIRGIEYIMEALALGRGALFLTGHLGNWEFVSLIGLLRLAPLTGPFHVVRRAIRMKWLEKIIFARVSRYGIKRIDSQGALVKINRTLKNKGKILFVMDQHAEIQNKLGIAVDFFGIKAGTFSSLAFFSQKFQAPVIPLSSYRMKNGKHILEFHRALTWEEHSDKEQAIYNNTLRYNQVLEQFILEHPEQWWWVHRRWKL